VDRGSDAPVIFFDGVCHVCSGLVRFVLRHDRRGRFRFAPLDSDVARARLGSSAAASDSVILLEAGRRYERADAVLRIARELGAPWSAAVVFRILPHGLRDWGYDWFARRRYRWFGKRETCYLPTPDERARFL
jgi:predicted DCC family thiol-disulfide oxidoreductase YuxK